MQDGIGYKIHVHFLRPSIFLALASPLLTAATSSPAPCPSHTLLSSHSHQRRPASPLLSSVNLRAGVGQATTRTQPRRGVTSYDVPEMDKSARFAVGGAMIRLQARAPGLLTRLTPCPTKVNKKFPSVRAGNCNDDGRRLRQLLAQGLWPNTFRFDRTALGKPIGPVTRQNSFEDYIGRPMEQIIADTCAIVACTVCLDAVHRLEHTKLHGEGTFKYRAAPSAAVRLLIACRLDGIWMPGEGANVGEVLNKIRKMGGLPATASNAPAPAPCVLPLRSWQKHRWGDEFDGELSPERVAALMDSHGPCIGVLWVCPWYGYFDAAGRNDALVYRGCGRSEDDRVLSERLYGKDGVGWHAVVCVAYRFCGGEMHVLVRDNHDAAANGPQRWVCVEELHTLYTLRVPLEVSG